MNTLVIWISCVNWPRQLTAKALRFYWISWSITRIMTTLLPNKPKIPIANTTNGSTTMVLLKTGTTSGGLKMVNWLNCLIWIRTVLRPTVMLLMPWSSGSKNQVLMASVLTPSSMCPVLFGSSLIVRFALLLEMTSYSWVKYIPHLLSFRPLIYEKVCIQHLIFHFITPSKMFGARVDPCVL